MDTIVALLICIIPLGTIFCLYFFLKKMRKDEIATLPRFKNPEEEMRIQDLIKFQGSENLTIHDILDAPGVVIGKSNYGTLYKAKFEGSGSVSLLRFLRPACTGPTSEILPLINHLGCIRHPNLVPLQAFYSGPRGEKLLVYPFFPRGTLSQFLQEGKSRVHGWSLVSKISLGIARGLKHLHTGLDKPTVHGNLKSKNVLLDSNYQPYLSDFGLHLLLNPAAGQLMIESSESQGYKAPELIKMKDASKESDIYSFGVILLEILTGKDEVYGNSSPSQNTQLPVSLRNSIQDRKVADMFNSQIQSHNNISTIATEELLKYFQLAIDCRSPSPSLRPSIKHIVHTLEEIGQ